MAQGNEFRVNWSGVGAKYTEAEIAMVAEVMRNADPLTQGQHKNRFEKAFAGYLGVKSAFAVSSCSAALQLAAVLSRLGPGDEVIVPAHTFAATAIPFARTGAKLVWADIDPATLVADPADLEKKITARTRVIVVVHLYGLMADMNAIMALARRHNCLVVEDCAQSLGATCGGKQAGSFGDYACFSFHTHKNISTLGEGGMLVVKDEEQAKLVPGLRHNGLRPFTGARERYWVPTMANADLDMDGVWPYKFTLGEAQCALGTMLLERIDALNAARRRRAEMFRAGVTDFPELVFQQVPAGFVSACHLLPARYDGTASGKKNHDFIAAMAFARKVKVIVQYYPLYCYPMFQRSGFSEACCPATDRFYDNMVSFPFHSWMPDEEFDYMLAATVQTLRELRGGK